MESSLENLYQTFAKYRLQPDISACLCCVTESDQAKLYKNELRKLTADDLALYSIKAVTTWGDEDDLKHFLPRILELWDELTLDIIFMKLQDILWETLTSYEKDAIVTYLESLLESLWHEFAQRPDDETYFLEFQIDDITEFLTKNKRAADPS